MNSLKVLDVTLRDGGCVNNFNFGKDYMNKILEAQEASNIDIIELGYIDSKNGANKYRTQFDSELSIEKNFLKNKKSGIKYVAMIDYGKFQFDLLNDRTNNSIDGIRLAFHKKNMKDIIKEGKKILAKGYELFIQPMITLRYEDNELLELISLVNKELAEASGFYIVDSFGEMRPNDMSRVMNLIDHNLNKSMPIGFHSHNNLQMSYSNAISMIQFPTNREIIIDCSIMGMGKGAGNLNTELLLEHLNLFYGKKYNIFPLLEVIDKVINPLHSEFYWGYAPEYYLSAIHHCTPSYASHFYNKHMLPIDQVSELLSLISEEKKISFDKEYAENLYRSYNKEKAIDDTNTIKTLKVLLSRKKILLVAPGKSIEKNIEKIQHYANDNDYITIGLNTTVPIEFDYYFTTRVECYLTALANRKNIIVPSNISKEGKGNVFIIDYGKWIELDNTNTYDSATVMCLNLLAKCNVEEVLLAGFDGFTSNINENYYDPSMRTPITQEQANALNKFNRKFINDKKENNMNIKFITPSLYI